MPTIPQPDRQTVPDGDQGFAGVYMKPDVASIEPGYLAAARNVRCRKGVPETRKGIIKPVWANRYESDKTVSYGTVYGVGVFKDPDSVEWQLIAAEGFVYRFRPHNPPESLPLPTGVQILGDCTFVQAFNKVFLFRGRYLAPLRMADFDSGFEDILAHYDAAGGYNVGDEIAWGPFLVVSSLTSVGATATVVTTAGHGYITGADVTMRGAGQSEYNIRANITVIDSTTFTYQFAGSATPTATGTIKCSNHANYYAAAGTLYTTGNSISNVTTTATFTHVAHGFANGQRVIVAGASPSEYLGTFTISNCTADTFDYTMVSDPGGSATGSITVRNLTKVLAGRNPDDNAVDWTQLYTILPNANEAIYVQSQLLVPTAYNPDTGLYDAKADYVVATDYLDEIHFDFVSQFRINQGSDDQLVSLCQFADSGTVICFKEKSYGVLSSVYLGLSAVTLGMQLGNGLASPRCFASIGADVYYLVSNRGVVSIQQTEQNKLQGVDLPLSDPIDALIQRINWNIATTKARMAYWDNKLFIAVPLDNGTNQQNVLPPGATYNEFDLIFFDNMVEGRSYTWTLGANELELTVGIDIVLDNSTFEATSNEGRVAGTRNAPFTGGLYHTVENVNNAILVYDFVNQAWQGYDTGSGIMVKEFFTATYCGKERLFFLSEDGFINLVEESDAGDQLESGSAPGLEWEEITTYIKSRGYTHGTNQHKRPRKGTMVVETWNPQYSINACFGGVNNTVTLCTARTKDNTLYYRPFNAAPWVNTNINDDHGTRFRQDYSVAIPDDGLNLGSGIVLDLFQETREPFSIPKGETRYEQFELTNTQGRIRLKAIEFEDVIGTTQRKGVHV